MKKIYGTTVVFLVIDMVIVLSLCLVYGPLREKIMISLKKADFFIVAKGKEGGYKLKRKPEEYSIGEIIRAADEELDVVSCIKNEKQCPAKTKCKTYSLWKELSDEINNFLDSKCLKDYL